jgi:Tol biopolymer transport system component
MRLLDENGGGTKMKNQFMIFGLIVFLLVPGSVVFTKPFETIEIGTGAYPRWSPDGTKIGFISDGWMWMRNADGTGEIENLFKIPEYAIHFFWLDSSVFMFQDTDGIATMTLYGKKSVIAKINRGDTASFYISFLKFLSDGTVGYYEIPRGKVIWETEKRIFRVIKPGKLPTNLMLKQMLVVEHIRNLPEYVNEGIWLESVDGIIKKKITSYRYFHSPVLSPDGRKILVTNGVKCDVGVLDLNGEETCVGKKSIVPVDLKDTTFIWGEVDGIPFWSSDSKRIAYAYERYKSTGEDNLEIVGSELYIENPDGTNRIQISIPDGNPTGPVWSPDGSRIACTDRFTAKIYVITLK